MDEVNPDLQTAAWHLKKALKYIKPNDVQPFDALDLLCITKSIEQLINKKVLGEHPRAEYWREYNRIKRRNGKTYQS